MTRTALQGFLAAYYHQDWMLETTDPLELARSFGADEPLETVFAAIGEAEVRLAMSPSENALRDWLRASSCYYNAVEPETHNSWLRRTVDVIVAAVGPRLAPPDPDS